MAPVSAQLPSGQQTDAPGALRVVVTLPAAHDAQTVALKRGLNVSGAHGAHAMAPVPASRVHAEPEGHGKHPGVAPLTKPGAQHVAHP